MNLLEVKNDLAKFAYNPEDNYIRLSDFLIVEDKNESLLAQVIHLESAKDNLEVGLLKFVLNIDKNGVFSAYRGYTPQRNSKIFPYETYNVLNLFKSKKSNITVGTVETETEIIDAEVSSGILKNKLYIQADYVDNVSAFISETVDNILGFNNSVLTIDFSGIFSEINAEKIIFGDNFKLPLNAKAIDLICQQDLKELPYRERVFIEDIFIELKKFAETTKYKFIPFNTIIDIINNEYNSNPTEGLADFRSKLLMYQQQGIFAQTAEEFSYLNQLVKHCKSVILDVTKVDNLWLKLVINFVLELIKDPCFVITELNDENSDKTIINNLVNTNNIYPILVSSYQYKHSSLVKALVKNLVLFTPIEKINDFAGYNSFLDKMNQDEFILWGKNTLYIPVIITQNEIEISNDEEIEEIAEDIEYNSNTQGYDEEDEIIKKDVDEMLFGVKEEDDKSTCEEEIESSKEDDNIEPESQEVKEVAPVQIQFETGTFASILENDASKSILSSKEESEVVNLSSEEEVKTDISSDSVKKEEENDIELSETEIKAEPLENDFKNLINESSVEESEIIDIKELNEDESFKTQEQEDFEISEVPIKENIVKYPQEDIEINDNFLDDDDLDLIDEINNHSIENDQEEELIANSVEFADEECEQQEDIIKENIAEEAAPVESTAENTTQDEHEFAIPDSTNTLPIYKATETDIDKDSVGFAEGNYVYHPKYGKGVIEKIAPYANKMLFSIIFDNSGRKLIDPTLSDLKQI